MDKESIEELLKGIHPNAKTTVINGWVSSSCPLAAWTHETGRDNSPSFGIKIEPEGRSNFNCFTCHRHGSLPKLLKLLTRYSGQDYTSMIASVETQDLLGAPLPEWGTKPAVVDRLGDPIDENIVYAYESAENHPYVRSRGISGDIAKLFGLLHDPDNRGVERILVPVRHVTGELYGFLGRAIGSGTPKVRDYNGLPKRKLLLGLDKARTTSHGYIVLVEGPFDCLRLWTLGYPAVAALHSSLTPAQASLLREHAKSVVLLYDNDRAGKEGRNHAAKMLRNYMPVFKTAYPVSYKDPGELKGRHMIRMMSNLKLM